MKSLFLAFLILTLSGCGKHKTGETVLFPQHQNEGFHADNDIAMTIRSVADAIMVGEILDSTEYDFKGVLTDGIGTPLYTDSEGVPGLWDIDVVDKGKVLIRNRNLGDLLPADLEIYLLESLHLTDANRLPLLGDSIVGDKRKISIYAFSGGYMKYEVVKDTANNGLEGSIVTITIGASPAPEVEIQKAA